MALAQIPAGIDPKLLQTIWRLTPASFATYLTRNEPQPWIPARHLKILSKAITDAVSGKTPRLIINMPPRHGKSELISKFTPVWFLDNWPHREVINVGFATEFAQGWGRKVRNLTQQFQADLRYTLASDSKAAGRWNTTRGGGMVATGIDGQITGKGADLLIIDDPHKDQAEASSLLKREHVWEWWTGTARSRVMPGGAVILVMTRWHEDDLAGRLLKAAAKGEGEQWRVLNLPAIYDEEAAKEGPDPLGRAIGDPLWPDFRPLDYLEAMQLGMSLEAWVAQFQGRPANLVGAGNVYKAFSTARNVRPVVFDPRRPLCWSLDFNVDPMCSTLSQWHEEDMPYTYLTNQRKKVISVLQEICLPNSSTNEACEEFVNRTQEYLKTLKGKQLHVRVYGDRSGQSRKTVGDTDYATVKDFFKLHPEYKLTFHLSRSNPSVRDRANAVNAMLANAAGEIRTLIDPTCTELIQDFKQVSWKRDTKGNTTGQIDKSDMARTHVSDAYGYHVEKEFGVKSTTAGGKPGILQ